MKNYLLNPWKAYVSKSQASLNSLASTGDLGSCCECDRMDRAGQAISCKSRKCVQEEYGNASNSIWFIWNC